MFFKPSDFMGHFTFFDGERAADMANKKLREFDMKASRLSSWPVTRERYRQVLGKARRLANKVIELEEKYAEPDWDSINQGTCRCPWCERRRRPEGT